MKARVTMRDVARAAGVSPMTVSRAFRDDATVSPATREAVRATAARLGYVYDTMAQAFRAQKSGFVAVTLPSINNANFAETYQGLSEALAPSGLQILLGSTNYDLGEEERLIGQLLERRPEAMVLTGGTHTETARALLAGQDIPLIEMWDLPAAPLGLAVGFSNAEAMRPVVAHLAARGRRRLAFLGAAPGTDHRGDERGRGVSAAAEALGLAPVRRLNAGPAPVSMSEGAAAITALGAGLAEIDAVVAVSDPVAFGAMMAARRLGLDVPGDLAMTGFGAFEIAAISLPRITTVDVSAFEIGHRTANLLAGELAGGGSGVQSVDLGARLRIGETT